MQNQATTVVANWVRWNLGEALDCLAKYSLLACQSKKPS